MLTGEYIAIGMSTSQVKNIKVKTNLQQTLEHYGYKTHEYFPWKTPQTTRMKGPGNFSLWPHGKIVHHKCVAVTMKGKVNLSKFIVDFFQNLCKENKELMMNEFIDNMESIQFDDSSEKDTIIFFPGVEFSEEKDTDSSL